MSLQRGWPILYSVEWLALAEMALDFSVEFVGNRAKFGLTLLMYKDQ